MKRLQKGATIVAGVIGGSIACLSAIAAEKPAYSTGASDKEIRLGHTTAYSGPASAFSASGHTYKAFFDMVNAAGGISGRKITLISLDDAYSPPKALEQTRKLVESDDVLLIFGVSGTPTNTATQKISERQASTAGADCHRRQQVQRSEDLSVDHAVLAVLRHRAENLCRLHPEA